MDSCFEGSASTSEELARRPHIYRRGHIGSAVVISVHNEQCLSSLQAQPPSSLSSNSAISLPNRPNTITRPSTRIRTAQLARNCIFFSHHSYFKYLSKASDSKFQQLATHLLYQQFQSPDTPFPLFPCHPPHELRVQYKLLRLLLNSAPRGRLRRTQEKN